MARRLPRSPPGPEEITDYATSVGLAALTGAGPELEFLYMCFKITPSLREHFNYRGVSAEVERRGYGSSRPQLAWAIRQKQHEPEKTLENQAKVVNSTSLKAPGSD